MPLQWSQSLTAALMLQVGAGALVEYSDLGQQDGKQALSQLTDNLIPAAVR